MSFLKSFINYMGVCGVAIGEGWGELETVSPLESGAEKA